jgi:predicted N-acetyltransferase YhbS
VITAVALLPPGERAVLARHPVTRVTMRQYTDDEIAASIARGDPFDKAGAYAIQDELFRPVESYDGCYCNAVGLPLRPVIEMLRKAGIPVTARVDQLLAPCAICPLAPIRRDKITRRRSEMSVETAPATLDHLERISDICYRAFKDISDRHGFPTDFEDEALARMVLGGLIRNESCHSTVALANGRVAGSNFITTADDVGTIGPVSVDPDLQGKGIGRALMEEALAFAQENGIERVRLMQDSFNMMSLALYLPADTKAPVALLEPAVARRARRPAIRIRCRRAPVAHHILRLTPQRSR